MQDLYIHNSTRRETQTPSKSQFFVHKLKRVKLLDRDIRRKWAMLQQQNMTRDQEKFKQIMEIQNARQLQNHLIEEQFSVQQKNRVNKIFKIREEIKRGETYLRKKNNEDIYFRKKERNVSPQMSLPKSSSQKKVIMSPLPRKRAYTQSEQSPLLLQKRGLKMQRQLKIINNQYINSLKKIQDQQKIDEMKQVFSQKSVLNKIKGSKMYYRIVSSFSIGSDS